jgi:biotin carboxyl carrier protein
MVEREASAGASQIASSEGLVFRAPMSGRFYRRAGPGKPAFVSEGDLISAGHTVCLLEVMKTFNRLAYGGDDLPERARVKAVLPADGDDIAAGAAILELEAAS